jgi:hypothetical protein
MADFVVYWGCWDESGHYYWHPDRSRFREYTDPLRVPKASQIDGSAIFLPHPEKPGEGVRTYLPAMNITVLAWWDRTFDSRPGTNAAIIVHGNITSAGCWERFAAAFPALAPKLRLPKPINN